MSLFGLLLSRRSLELYRNAAAKISEATVRFSRYLSLVFTTSQLLVIAAGAGFSADSGLAVVRSHSAFSSMIAIPLHAIA